MGDGRTIFRMDYEQAIKDLQDNLVVIAEIERRQSRMLLEHSEHIGELIGEPAAGSITTWLKSPTN